MSDAERDLAWRHWHVLKPLIGMALDTGQAEARRLAGALASGLLKDLGSDTGRFALHPKAKEAGISLDGSVAGDPRAYCARQLLGMIDDSEMASQAVAGPLQGLYRTGALTYADFRAAEEIRWAVEIANTSGGKAVDFTKMKVDGGLGPFGAILRSPAAEEGAARRVARWMDVEMNRRDYVVVGKVIETNALQITAMLVCRGMSCRAADKLIGIKSGRTAGIVSSAIKRFSMMAAPERDG